LRFDLQANNDSWYYAEYSTFVVLDDTSNYTLQVSGYSGNAGDAFTRQSGFEFTTYDRDNDPWNNSNHYRNNCAELNGGGCWFSLRGTCDFNNVRGRGYGFRWWPFDLQTSRMWLTC